MAPGHCIDPSAPSPTATTTRGVSRRSMLGFSAVALGLGFAGSQLNPTSAFGATPLMKASEIGETLFTGEVKRWAIPTFDKKRILQSLGLSSPIWSDADAIYIADSIGNAPAQGETYPKSKLVVARILKSNRSSITSTEVGTFDFDGSNVGHRGSSVVVTADGSILAHPATHTIEGEDGTHSPLTVFRSGSPHSVSSFRLQDFLPGQTGSAYRRFFYDPYTNNTYLLNRGTNFQALLWRWDASRQRLLRVDRPGTRPSALEPGGPDGLNLSNEWNLDANGNITTIKNPGTGAYGHEIAFMSDGAGGSIMFCAPEFTVNEAGTSGGWGQTGYPRRDISLVCSYDGGHVWSRLGKLGTTPQTIADPFRPTMPGRPSNIDIIFPGPTYNENTPETSRNNSVNSRVAVSGKRAVVVANWDGVTPDPNAYDSKADYQRIRGLFARTWDAQHGVFHPYTATLIAPAADSSHHAGSATVAYTRDGRIVVVASDYDDHSIDGGTLIAGDYLAQPYPTVAKLYVFTSTDGIGWKKYAIHTKALQAAAGTTLEKTPVSGAYIDAPSLERDGVIRLYPIFPSAPTRAEVWEVTIPGFTGVAAPKLKAPAVLAGAMGGAINLAFAPSSDGGSSNTKFRVYRSTSATMMPASPWATMNYPLKGVIDIDAPENSTRYYSIATVSAAGVETSERSPVLAVPSKKRERTVLPNGLLQQNNPNGSTPPYVFTEQPPVVPSHVFRSDAIGKRTNGVALQAGDRIGTWTSAPPAGVAARVAINPVSPANGNAAVANDSRPVLINDGPNGYPALRFNRAEATQLLVDAANGTSCDVLTVFTVARVRDYEWNHLISSQHTNGLPQQYGPHSRTSYRSHETRFTDGGISNQGVASNGFVAHQVTAETGVGPWRIYESQWRVGAGSRRRLSGMISFCEGQWQELPLTSAPANEPPSIVDSPLQRTKYMTIGAAKNLAGGQLTSEVDIAEVMRFDKILTRAELYRVAKYLTVRYALTPTNLVPQDTSPNPPLATVACVHPGCVSTRTPSGVTL